MMPDQREARLNQSAMVATQLDVRDVDAGINRHTMGKSDNKRYKNNSCVTRTIQTRNRSPSSTDFGTFFF